MAAFSARALSDAETQRIHAVALRVLAEVGVDVCDEQILARHRPIVPPSRVEDLRRYVEANR